MSTAPPVGALKRCLNDLPAHASFASLRSAAEEFEAALPSPVWDAARRAWALVTGMPGGGTLFEDLGFSYSGPIDGPDMAQVLVTRRAARTRAPC